MEFDPVVRRLIMHAGHDPVAVAEAVLASNRRNNTPDWCHVDFGALYSEREGLPERPYGRYAMDEGRRLTAISAWVTHPPLTPMVRYVSGGLDSERARLILDGFPPETMMIGLVGRKIREIVRHPALDIPDLRVLAVGRTDRSLILWMPDLPPAACAS